MSFAIAAAGTGGHVFPALAVAEALVDSGVAQAEIVFFGGTRFEATAVPEAGFDLVSLDVQGLKRSLSADNFRLPLVVRNAAKRVAQELRIRGTRVLLATGGYVTVPAGWGAKRAGVPFFVQEQNAEPGLANRVMSRWSEIAFTSFESTHGLHRPHYVGNPVRGPISRFVRDDWRSAAFERYRLDPALPTIGVVGGSLGARAINDAVADMVKHWSGPHCQIVHLAGQAHAGDLEAAAGSALENPRGITWRVVPFEPDMHYFFAATDLLIARAGGMVAEFTATATPAILIPGDFGSSGHQAASAQVLTSAGAAVTILEPDLSSLGVVAADLMADDRRRAMMTDAARAIGRPQAAKVIAERLVAAHG